MNQPIKNFPEAPSIGPAQPAKPRSRGRFILTVILILLVVAGVVWWTRHGTAPQPGGGGRNAAPMSIVPEVVGKGDIGVNINALGTVTSLATVTVRTQISGYLMKIDFKEGDEVKKGDLLAEIDPRPYEAALAQAKGQLARDEAMLKGAQVDLARYQGLAAQNAVPHQTLDTQIALVAQDQGTVEADKAAVKSAEVNLAYCRIVSPLDGRVGLRQVDQGNYVTPGDANGHRRHHPVAADQRPVHRARGQSAGDRRSACRPARCCLQPRLIAPAPPRSRTARCKPSTARSIRRPARSSCARNSPTTNELLYPNQFVNIRLLLDTHKDATTMSTAGIQRGAPGTFVYLVNADSTVSVRPVKLGVTDGERVEVLSGLAPGDRIVIDGADKLRDGAKIVIRVREQPDADQPGPDAGRTR